MQSDLSDPGLARPDHSVTRYSIDISAFEPVGHHGHSPSIPYAQIDHMASDDLDGPSDFTLDMEKWMREGNGSRLVGSARIDRETNSRDEQSYRPSVEEHTLSTIPSQPSSHHTPDRSPPRASLGSPPRFLAKQVCSAKGNSDDNAVSKSRSSAEGHVKVDIRSDVEQHLEDLRERCLELERLNRNITEAMQAQLQSWEDERAIYHARMQQAYQREKDLQEMKRIANQHMEAFRDGFAEQNHRLSDLEIKYREKQAELDNMSKRLQDSERGQNDCRTQADQYFDQLQELRLVLQDNKRENNHLQAKNACASGESMTTSTRRENSIHETAQPSTRGTGSLLAQDTERQAAASAAESRVRAQLQSAQARIQALERDVAWEKECSDRLVQQLSDQQSINARLDARMCEEVRKRDERWRKRFQSSRDERHLMSQVLLHQWGSTEVGSALPQLYEYKYRAS